jgi:uncharacterized RmlC-like cupin family protein
MRFALKLAVLLTALPLTAAAQDAAKVDAAHYKVLVENSAVRVLKISMPPGAKSVMHSHPDAIVVPLASAKALFTLPDGKTQDIELVKDTPLYTPAFTHLPANVGASPVEAILVEFKGTAAGSATLPTSRANAQMTPLAEGPRAVAFKVSLMPEFHEPAGSTHDYDQVVVALAESDTSLAIEGQPLVTKWKRGDVQFIGRGVKHESKNPTGKPIDLIIVGIK